MTGQDFHRPLGSRNKRHTLTDIQRKVLDCLISEVRTFGPSVMPTRAICRATGIPSNHVSRNLLRLEDLGYFSRRFDGRYVLHRDAEGNDISAKPTDGPIGASDLEYQSVQGLTRRVETGDVKAIVRASARGVSPASISHMLGIPAGQVTRFLLDKKNLIDYLRGLYRSGGELELDEALVRLKYA